ncbi:MAG: PaaI family thioesterase [Vulcanimicrobiaceae bacterium]
MTSLERPVDDGHCIGCGTGSAIGLHMTFATADDRSVASRLTIPQRFQGWRDVVHGGVVALVLDEAMAYAAGAHGYLGVTGDLKLRFRQPVTVGVPLVVRARVRWQRRTVLSIEATLHDEAETLLASAEGSFVARGVLAPGEQLGTPRNNGGT